MHFKIRTKNLLFDIYRQRCRRSSDINSQNMNNSARILRLAPGTNVLCMAGVTC